MENLDYVIQIEKKADNLFHIKKNALDKLTGEEVLTVFNRAGKNLMQMKQQKESLDNQIKMLTKDFEALKPFAEKVRGEMQKEMEAAKKQIEEDAKATPEKK